MSAPRIGVLSLQGCVQPHQAHIESLGALYREVKLPQDFESIDGLILPGGESTTMLKLIEVFLLDEILQKTFARIPVWGVCAGAILMAKEVRSPSQKSFGLLDMVVERNSYGRQLDSFNTLVNGYEVSFIRAPGILSTGPGLQVMAEIKDKPIWVKQGHYMATTFHPELSPTTPSPMHRAFYELVISHQA